MVRLHPYEYVYFNRLFGGGQEFAGSRFETDYWGLSYKEGVEWVGRYYQGESSKVVAVANCGFTPPFLSEYFVAKESWLRERVAVVGADQNPDVVLATTRFGCDRSVKGEIVHVVERAGMPLLYVIRTGK